jgi:hypothetical protein
MMQESECYCITSCILHPESWITASFS